MSKPFLNKRELGTVLAALRYWQRVGTLDVYDGGADAEDNIATDGGKLQPLDVGEIDELCEKLNIG